MFRRKHEPWEGPQRDAEMRLRHAVVVVMDYGGTDLVVSIVQRAIADWLLVNGDPDE